MGFQPAKRTERKPAKVLLQFSNVVPSQAYIVDEISRALKVTQIHPIKLLAKMLLCLQHLNPNRLEPRDKGLNFDGEVLAHGIKDLNEFVPGGFSLLPRAIEHPARFSLQSPSGADGKQHALR